MIENGLALYGARRFVEAERCFQTVLQQDPKHPDALHMMGLLAIEANQFSAAIDYMQRALQRLPRQPMYLNNLGNAMILAHKPADALRHLRKAIKLSPRYAEAHNNLGRAYRALGQADEARKCFARALAIEPEFIRAQAALGEMLVEIGDMQEAAQVFRTILARDPHNVQALGGLSSAVKFTENDPELDNFEAALKAPNLIPDHRVILHHAAGKICNDLGRYDDAMQHYFAGKKAAGLQFPIALHHRSYASLRRNFSKAGFAGNFAIGNPSNVPVFIVGMPRSGTTLTEQIIASHPQASGAGELPDIRRAGTQLGYGLLDVDVYAKNVRALGAAEAGKIASAYLRSLTRGVPRTALRVSDKNPQNYEQLGLIARLFPNAHVVHCRRNPVDTCISNFMQSFDQSHGYNADLTVLGQYYRDYVQLIDHWRRILPLKFLDLDYEDMISDQERTSRRLIEFLGLDWDDECLRYFDNKRSVTTPSRWQVRQPIYASSVNRWRRYERHLTPLFESLGDLAG